MLTCRRAKFDCESQTMFQNRWFRIRNSVFAEFSPPSVEGVGKLSAIACNAPMARGIRESEPLIFMTSNVQMKWKGTFATCRLRLLLARQSQ
jgi:hypothetical protein